MNKQLQLSGQGGVGSSSSMIISSSDLLDAKLEEHKMCSSKHCPSCGHKLSDGKPDWLGLPAGVKFDPTDQELIEHLEAKVESIDDHIKSHPLIDEFIPTIEGEDGICYTHPEKLPGVTRDGLSRHFFHRPSKAYTTGTRKRRKIQTECCDLQATGGETRWHKTGKTRPVMSNGKQKGCKKILVLYTNFGKNRKPEKTNWVMHQYHLGQHEEEKEGELVVSKIFYQTQPRQCNWVDRTSVIGEGSTTTGVIDGGRRDSGSGSGSSSKENNVVVLVPHHQVRDGDHHHHQLRDSGVSAVMAAAFTNYGGMEMHQQLKADQFSGFAPFRKNFDEVGLGEVATSARVRDQVQASTSGTCQEHDLGQQPHFQQHHHQQQQQHHHPHQQQQQHQHSQLTTTFHISRPSPPISTIISPHPPPVHHSASIILNHQDPYHTISRMMIQNESDFHQQRGLRSSASGLEELIMGCTSNSTTGGGGSGSTGPGGDIKAESSMSNPQEADQWVKYSSFWNDPDNPDDDHNHHG